MLPKNSINSHVDGNVKNTNATAAKISVFNKSPIVHYSFVLLTLRIRRPAGVITARPTQSGSVTAAIAGDLINYHEAGGAHGHELDGFFSTRIDQDVKIGATAELKHIARFPCPVNVERPHRLCPEPQQPWHQDPVSPVGLQIGTHDDSLDAEYGQQGDGGHQTSCHNPTGMQSRETEDGRVERSGP